MLLVAYEFAPSSLTLRWIRQLIRCQNIRRQSDNTRLFHTKSRVRSILFALNDNAENKFLSHVLSRCPTLLLTGLNGNWHPQKDNPCIETSHIYHGIYNCIRFTTNIYTYLGTTIQALALFNHCVPLMILLWQTHLGCVQLWYASTMMTGDTPL